MRGIAEGMGGASAAVMPEGESGLDDERIRLVCRQTRLGPYGTGGLEERKAGPEEIPPAGITGA